MEMSALSLTLPIVTIVGLLGFVAWGTFMLTTERNRIDKRIDRLVDSVEHLASSFESYSKSIDAALKSNYSLADHELWSARTEILNPSWKSARISRSETNPAMEQ